MNDKNEMMQEQENKATQVMTEIKEEYIKTAEFLEENVDQQMDIAKELKEEMKNNDFDNNIEELKALKNEITDLKAEIKRLNEMEKISLSSLVMRDIKAVGNALMNLQEKAIGSIKNLYDNVKHQLSYNLTKVQEKFVQMKISLVKGLVNSMQDFIKEQQKKLDNCLEKLDTLSQEIQKDEEKLSKCDKEEVEETKEQSKENKVNSEKEKENTLDDKKAVDSKTKNREDAKEKSANRKAEKKPSVLKKLKENQQKVRQNEQNKDIKAPKKDKGMEI